MEDHDKSANLCWKSSVWWNGQPLLPKPTQLHFFPPLNFVFNLHVLLFEAKLPKKLVLLAAHSMKKNQGVRFTNTVNTSVVSNNPHIILLGSSFRLLIKRIKNIQGAFYHSLLQGREVSTWTRTIAQRCSDGTGSPSESPSWTPDTLGNIHCPQDSSLHPDRSA